MSVTVLRPQRVTPRALLVLPSSAPREDWLATRRTGITATDLPKIVGASKYASAVDVFLEKTARTIYDPDISEAGEWGVLLEDTVARRWAEINDVKVRRVGLIANDTESWMLASLDRLVTGCPTGRCALEVKTRNAYVASVWEEGVPEDVVVQVQWQLAVSGLDHVHIAALVGGQRLIEHTVTPDAAMADWLNLTAWQVWQCVQEGVVPNVDPALMSVDLLNQVYPDREGVRDLTGTDADVWLDRYRHAAAAESDARKDKEAAKVHLLALLKDGEEAVIDGQVAFTYRAGKDSMTVPSANLARLREDFPDAFEAVAVIRRGSRTFSVKGMKA